MYENWNWVIVVMVLRMIHSIDIFIVWASRLSDAAMFILACIGITSLAAVLMLIIFRKTGQCRERLKNNGALNRKLGLLTRIQAIFCIDTVYHMAYYDSLTGLPNRNLFYRELNRELDRARKSCAKGALFFIDLDNFKIINDELGHQFGDKLLEKVAERLTDSTTKSCTVARLGGDEFVVLRPGTFMNRELMKTIQSLINALDEPWILGGCEYRLTASIGVAVYPEDGIDAEQLIEKADKAMYKAKENKSACSFYWAIS